MKVLVATSRTQGARDNDYHWCVDGELVRMGEVCECDQGDPDGGCGCGRGFAGLNSHRATTTALVAEISLSWEHYYEAWTSSLREESGESCGCCAMYEAEDLARLVRELPVGTVLERRLDHLMVREGPVSGAPG